MAAVAALHAVVCVLARQGGFDHISDDDFSRVTIAQSFAHSPKLDPSGTSWLPFPFWLLGSMLALFGRSLVVARACSIVFASVAAPLPYLALRFSGVPRVRSLVATAFALITPWTFWVGATTVPESFTASFVAAGAIGLAAAGRTTARDDVLRPQAAILLFASGIAAACLSRYETWPAAAVLGSFLVLEMRTQRSLRRSLLVGTALCALGPVLWIAWNAHAHDGPLHFFRRVARFKQDLGEGTTGVAEALALYPTLLFNTRPEVVIPALFLLPSALRDAPTRQRWGVPLLCGFAQLAFLSYGNVQDGAPTHHPERALIATTLLLALFVCDVGMTKLANLALDGRRVALVGSASVFALAWIISSVRGATPPAQSPSEDRSEQIARGDKLRQDGVTAIDVTPCAFEHFALIASFGAPERVEVKASRPATPAGCPVVQSR